jgi:hypothetical protein
MPVVLNFALDMLEIIFLEIIFENQKKELDDLEYVIALNALKIYGLTEEYEKLVSTLPKDFLENNLK